MKQHGTSITIEGLTFSTLASITASHCCICRKSLTDAESVQLGIGPICSSRYYKLSHEPTPKEVKVALGIVVAAKHLTDNVKEALRSLKRKGDFRTFANLLVKWASAHYDQRDVVLDCADAVEALGFTEMAERLRMDRSPVYFGTDPEDANRFLVAFKGSKAWAMVNDIRRYLTLTPTTWKRSDAKGFGNRDRFSFERTDRNEQLVKCLLSVHFGGQQATIEGKGLKTIPRASHQDFRDLLNPPAPNAPPAQPVAGAGLVSQVNGHIEVRSPRYDARFVAGIKALPYKDRRWNGSAWVVNPAHEALVTKLAEDCFGPQA